MYAPQVLSTGWDGMFLGNETPEMAKLPGIAFSKDMAGAQESLEAAGFDVKKLIELSPDCWLYKGDLRPATALRLKTKLVVKGNCDFPEGSILETDLRADGSLIVGPNSLCRGNLIAGRHIQLGPGCRFAGLIHADGAVQLGRGTRGFKEDGLVVAYAGEDLKVERDVAIKGKLAAGGRVIVESVEAAEAGSG
jgi:hypothetical protein